jgi:hypothetical protein
MKYIAACIMIGLLSVGCPLVLDLQSVVHGKLVRPDVKVDQSGVMQHQTIKGWLANTPSRRVAVTCSHANPAVNARVWFVDKTGDKTYYTVTGTFKVIAPGPGSQGCDITVLSLDRPVDPRFTAYNYATSVKRMDWVNVVNRYGRIISANIVCGPDSPAASLSGQTEKLIPGDSGLPWFNLANQVVGHTTLGDKGFGPVYSHPLILGKLQEALAAAEKHVESVIAKP